MNEFINRKPMKNKNQTLLTYCTIAITIDITLLFMSIINLFIQNNFIGLFIAILSIASLIFVILIIVKIKKDFPKNKKWFRWILWSIILAATFAIGNLLSMYYLIESNQMLEGILKNEIEIPAGFYLLEYGIIGYISLSFIFLGYVIDLIKIIFYFLITIKIPVKK
ncbi:hypothetical protein [Mycoplasma sp. Mirounga ES2805-ORL]|uniref:hypothetical protein n=1 Tax=Mycoplasma sp. Mirounga ES2805-ORL TaxID=754514 RepID=UPI00197B6263|nr:hypothetical protein [Mycoplasma sp. Mirounga ES2805-ORL]QSF13596.1 hypothetical protein JXZ90_02940 [Mycoplasma sp. Mirounga ES2805-ORL]